MNIVNMEYRRRIAEILGKIPQTIVDFKIERKRGRPPTQAFSEFLTNREQGDWTESLIKQAVHKLCQGLVAVQYGKSDNIVAGEEGFEEFYESYQDELDNIGKRPDILLYGESEYNNDWNYDISRYPQESLDEIVPRSIAGIEIRSSSFLLVKYTAAITEKNKRLTAEILEHKTSLLENYSDVLDEKTGWRDVIGSLNEECLDFFSFRVPGWRASQRVFEANAILKKMKRALIEYQKRDCFSFTPKVEDIKVVNKWIHTYNVPHYYVQVFFDKVYGISFENILQILTDSNNEGSVFFIEADAKNQNKSTTKINIREGLELAHKVAMPEHRSQVRELPRGRLLFHVTFEGGEALLNLDNLNTLIGV